MASQSEIELRMVKEAILDRVSKIDLSPLNEAIAETAASIKANAKNPIISFGSAPRSAE